jgi:hypothetical protein
MNMLGVMESVEDLPGEGEPGDAYLVGEEAPYYLYMWNDLESVFVNAGALTVGPQGPQGPVGPPGATPTISDATNAVKGIARFATDTEVTTGTLETAMTNPKQLKAVKDTIPSISGLQATSQKGAANGYAGLDENLLVAATNLPDATTTSKGAIQIATDEEAYQATDGTHALAPRHLNDVLRLGGGMLEGDLVAQYETDLDMPQVRNIVMGTTDLTAGTSSLDRGSIYLVYE